MKMNIKKYLIPDEENNFEPHIFRNTGLVFLTTIALFTFLSTVFGRIYVDVSGMRANVLSSVVIDITNEKRKENDLQPLTYDATLENAAKMKVDDMVKNNYFAHVSPGGINPWYWFKEAGYVYFYAGENLAVDFDDSDSVTKAWMASPNHRANILNGKFTEIGVATSEGSYKGHPTTFVVQMFGTRAIPITQSPVSKAITVSKIALTNESVKTNPSVLGDAIEGEKIIEIVDSNILNQDFVYTQTSEKKVEPDLVRVKENIIPKNGSVIDSLIVSPEKGMIVVYFAIALIIFIGILFRINVEYKRHHYKHVLFGIVLIVFLIGLFFLYHLLFGGGPVYII